MKRQRPAKISAWVSRVTELALILAICALAMYWALILIGAAPPPATVPAGTAIVQAPADDALISSAALFGARRPGNVSENIQALGIIADLHGAGSAILSMDGQPARHYRTGDHVDGATVRAIRAGEVEIETSGVRKIYKLPVQELPEGGIVRH